jgi:hypothetical protein
MVYYRAVILVMVEVVLVIFVITPTPTPSFPIRNIISLLRTENTSLPAKKLAALRVARSLVRPVYIHRLEYPVDPAILFRFSEL